MALEIERKFLVNSDVFKKDASNKERIVQGFLSSVPERTVRIRVIGESAYITVKGIGSATGVTRYEWEKEIQVKEALDLLKICEPGVISKMRYYIKSNNRTFEVDEFYDENDGLIIAEIELTSEEESFEKPNWLGTEVTGITKYYNSSLVKSPYKNW